MHGIGGIIKDNRGQIALAYLKQISSRDPLDAEMLAMAKGIQLLMSHGHKKVILEGDNMLTTEATHTLSSVPFHLMTIWKKLIIHQLQVQCYRRQSNQAAYALPN